MTAVLRISRAALAANIDVLRARVSPAELMLVVKDDAYGHGLDNVIPTALEAGITWIGAFDLPTALRVRALAGDSVRVFAWMVAGDASLRTAIDAGIDLGVGDPALLDDVVRLAAAHGTTARVHLKIDTGLHRNGIRPEEWTDAVARTAAASAAGALSLEGVWSHLAEASNGEDDAARARFDEALAVVHDAGLTPPRAHLAASAAAFQRPEFRYDMVRIGAFNYGIRPAGGPGEHELGIAPVASLDADVIEVRGGIAVLGVGALDGLPSTLGGRTVARSPAGLVAVRSVDDLTTSVDAWPHAAVGETVRIYGVGAPSATDLAEAIDTIGEEIAVRLSPLIERRAEDDVRTR